MSIPESIAWCIVLTLALSACGGSGPSSNADPVPETSSQLLYVLTGNSASTYSIDPSSLTLNQLGGPSQLTPQPIVQFVASPNDHFLYAVWSTTQGAQQLSVFATDASGLPITPGLQTLDVPSLSQLNIHRSGKFAYMMQSITSGGLYWSYIRLFHVNTKSGSLTEDSHIQAIYGPSPIPPASLYGFSPDGTKLLISLQTPGGTSYIQSPISQGGSLGSGASFYRSGRHWGEPAIGEKVFVNTYRPSGAPLSGFLDVFATSRPSQPEIHCTSAMLAPCASATNTQLDPFGQRLFLTDPNSQLVHILQIDTANHRLSDTGNSIPFTAEVPGYAFSPDGSLIYAVLAGDQSLHVYAYDQNSGTLTSGASPLPLPPGSGFLPTQHR